MRLLIVSTLDSDEPFGAYTRPFYLGMYLAQHFEVCQLGLNCSNVDYARTVSVNQRNLGTYVKAVKEQISTFRPDIIYAQETLPGTAALLACQFGFQKQPALVFDFHTLSANEYWTRLSTSKDRLKEFKQFMKTYIAQGVLVASGKPIVAAGTPVVQGIQDWYGIHSDRIHCVKNGVPEDLLAVSNDIEDPFGPLRPAKIVVAIAPKTFQFPSNDMSADMTVDIAKQLEDYSEEIHFVIVGRTAKDVQAQRIPKNLSFAGFLPSRQDFVTHLQQADIGLLPFPREAVAGGARNKALDYLACGNLVVSTPEGIRGLEDFHDRQHLLVAEDDVEAIAHTLLDACRNLSAYRHLRDTASQLVQREYSWKAMADRLASILRSVQS